MGVYVTSASLDTRVGPKEQSGKSVQLGQCPGGQDVGPEGTQARGAEHRNGSGLSVREIRNVHP